MTATRCSLNLLPSKSTMKGGDNLIVPILTYDPKGTHLITWSKSHSIARIVWLSRTGDMTLTEARFFIKAREHDDGSVTLPATVMHVKDPRPVLDPNDL